MFLHFSLCVCVCVEVATSANQLHRETSDNIVVEELKLKLDEDMTNIPLRMINGCNFIAAITSGHFHMKDVKFMFNVIQIFIHQSQLLYLKRKAKNEFF